MMDDQLMLKLNKLDEFKHRLHDYFVSTDSEWVDVYITPLGRMDLFIVSDRFDERAKALEFLHQYWLEIKEFYRLGFQTFYTVDDAEFFGIEKPTKRQDTEINWEVAVRNFQNHQQIICPEKGHSSRVISFYSYKGGVGRTVAMIQTAYLLAKSGHNVLLMDLDLEAPSLQDIFADQLDVKYGVVDWLYVKMIGSEKESKVRITDIYTQLTFDQTFPGKIYVISAGVLSPEYVFKLKQLQPNFISQRNYMSELIKEVETNIPINLVLVDSRTGLDDWGAFSLLEMADDIICFAYPNQENFKGLKLILDLMKTQCNTITIAFSKVEPKDIDRRQEFLEALELKQALISILYNPLIAVAKKFPVEEALDEYKDLADFILDKLLNV